MRGLRFVQMAALAAFLLGGAGKAHAIIHLELEGGGGLSLRGPEAPMASARVGLNLLSLLDVGLRGEYIFGQAPTTCTDIATCPNSSRGYQGWAAFPEIRLKTPTPIVQGDLALGGGLGYLKGINISGATYNGNGAAKPYGQAGVGVRLNIPTTDVYIRAEGSIAFWSNVTGPDIGNGLNPGILPVWQVMAFVGYTGIGF
ncbi:MAG: hypothetical protein JST54_20805 [Deltaproteobacteria bacterium]|nr:hypothetical protein [Deltaproteobacteria bacterium]